MFDLTTAIDSGSLPLLILTAASLGFLHTIMGPDHYIPFVMMARAQNWTRRKTFWVTSLCGVGHVGSSIVIGIVLAWAGMAVTEWAGSRWAVIHEFRGSLSAWLLIGFGMMMTVWGTVRAMRGKKHTHLHLHPGNIAHSHEHSHADDHMHPHTKNGKSITPWVLFVIFVFGPCESLIPLILAAWSIAGAGGVTVVSITFSLVTIVTILAVVGLLLAGLKRIDLGPLEKWSTALAGLSLVACGGAINWLGL